MNRELRRLQEREERRQKARGAQPRQRRERTSLLQFMREVRQELRRVAWPSREELWTFTVVTVVTSGVLTGLTFVMDLAFKKGILETLQRL